MAKCIYCGISYSSKVLHIHQEQCSKKNKQFIKEANEINLDKATKADLIVYILSESEALTESELKKINKPKLFDIAYSIK